MSMMKIQQQSILAMDTMISIQVVSSAPGVDTDERLKRAFRAFREVESICTRFDPQSEVMQLTHITDAPVKVSDVLFQAVSFACEVASLTSGIFDPTVGQAMEKLGFNRHYLSGDMIQSNLESSSCVSYRDIVLDSEARTIRLRKPLILDLGAVAKGLAVDLAARELDGVEGFAIDAGGDVRVSGVNGQGQPWRVGLRHPLQRDDSILVLRLSDGAVCTSGSYERRSKADPNVHHLIDPRTRTSSEGLLSATVIAPFAMMADALSTAVFLEGYPEGLNTLEQVEAEGVLISPTLDLYMTQGMKRYRDE